MPGPKAGSVDDTRKILRRPPDDAGAQSGTNHVAAVDDRMVHRRVGSQVVLRRAACAERDKRLVVRIDSTSFRSGVSRRTSGLRRAIDAGPIDGLRVLSLDIGAPRMDGLPNRISYNTNLAATYPGSAVAGLS